MSATAAVAVTTVQQFVEGEYLAHAEASLAKSTLDGYKKMWRAYGEYFAQWDLEMRTCDAQSILRQICADNPKLNKTTLRHVKNFFSGIWAHALRMGCCERDGNPWRTVAIPAAPDPNETYAYSPQEINDMLAKLGGQAHLIVLLAACTGLRKSEIRGLRWMDFNAETSTLSVNRAVWQSHVKTTKSAASKAPVPVVPVLAAKLIKHKSLVSGKDKSFMFPSSAGTAIDLGNLAARAIKPAVGKLWHGWHAFRRGLATFLHAQGVDDKTIQAILRHENVAITQKSYIKTIPESVRAAMVNVKFGCNSSLVTKT